MNKLPSRIVLSDINISSEKVKKKIDELKPNSAPGPDGITPRFLKLTANAMSKALATIFNRSLQSGIVPEDWKSANVTPIFKKGVKAIIGRFLSPASPVRCRSRVLGTNSGSPSGQLPD